MKLSLVVACSVVVVVGVGGCGDRLATSPPGAVARTPSTATGTPTEFDYALSAFLAHDAANDWTDASCKEVAARFEAVGTAPAVHDAALAYQRCGRIDDAIRVLDKGVADASFRDARALVTLASLQMKRDGSSAAAKLNLHRALAIDDGSMAAYDQLALWYLGARRLELAALVCAQAMKKSSGYAPIHNTAGLVENAIGRVNGAVAEFALARSLDPNLFEAHMNYAFVNLGFRGFDQAREAFEQALRIRPNDYDAHLGLALALRGPLTGMEADFEERIRAVQSELDRAKRIDPGRADAYFNEGILMQEFKARAGGDKERTKAVLREAEQTYRTFLEKAAGKARYERAVKSAGERIADIDATLRFL